MPKHSRIPKFFLLLSLAIVFVLTVGAFATGATNLHALFGQVSCNSASACDGGTNAGAGPGVQGDSAKGNGVVGNTTFKAATVAAAAVIGTDKSTTGIGNFGLEGVSPKLVGAAGFTAAGNFGAVQGDATSTTATSAGVTAFSSNVTGSSATTGTGVFADGGVGVTAVGESSLAHALELDVTHSGSLLRGFSINGTTTTEEIQIDAAGNEILKGKLTQHGSPHLVSRTSAGADVVAYGPRQTQPTMEDVGEARLVNGQAFVRIDPTFASAIDRSGNYLVYITPKGDSRGLYVSQQSAAGFVVRENQGGHSSLAFDYRIVGRPYDSTEARLPLVTQHEALNDSWHSPLRVPVPINH